MPPASPSAAAVAAKSSPSGTSIGTASTSSSDAQAVTGVHDDAVWVNPGTSTTFTEASSHEP